MKLQIAFFCLFFLIFGNSYAQYPLTKPYTYHWNDSLIPEATLIQKTDTILQPIVPITPFEIPSSPSDVYGAVTYLPGCFDFYKSDTVPLTVDMLKGGWRRVVSKCYRIAAPNWNCDADYEISCTPVSGHLYFEDSTVYYMKYPCRVHCKTNFNLSEGEINYHNYTEYLGAVSCFEDGSNDIHLLENGEFLYMGGEYYQREKLHRETIQFLKKRIFNPDCLLGEWALVTEGDGGYGDFYEISYPWKLPDTLNIKPSKAKKSVAKQQICLKVDGKYRSFFIHWIDKEDGELSLKPGAWYNEKEAENYAPLEVQYQQNYWAPKYSQKE